MGAENLKNKWASRLQKTKPEEEPQIKPEEKKHEETPILAATVEPEHTTAEEVTEEELHEVVKREPLYFLNHTIDKAKAYCKEQRQDWVMFVTGMEGSGKSTLASHICKRFDPNYSIDESMIYSFRDGDHSFLKFMRDYKDTPYKVAWYDEAVTVLFSHRASSGDSTDAQEIFKIKRDCRHFDILVSPSFWDLVPDIRERRIKSLLYCFTEVYHPTAGRTKYRHKYAYFSGSKIMKLSENKKAKYAFRAYKELFRIVRPDFIEEFPDMDEDRKEEYMTAKRANRNTVLDRIEGITSDEGGHKLLLPNSFNLESLYSELSKLNPDAVNEVCQNGQL